MGKLTREEVYKLIDGERTYQEKKKVAYNWRSDEYNGVGDFITYIDVYLTQAKTRLTKETGNQGGLDELRKVAALAVACMETFGCPARPNLPVMPPVKSR